MPYLEHEDNNRDGGPTQHHGERESEELPERAEEDMPIDHEGGQAGQAKEEDQDDDLAIDVHPLLDKEEEILVPHVVILEES